MSKPFAFTTCMARNLLSAASVVFQERTQEQRAAPCLLHDAVRTHRAGHRSLIVVPIERAGLLLRPDPCTLHVAQFDLLRLVELVAQPAERRVEDRVPDPRLAIVAGV